jgi:hypothetical protein
MFIFGALNEFYSFNLFKIYILEIAHTLPLGKLDYSKKCMQTQVFMANEIPF